MNINRLKDLVGFIATAEERNDLNGARKSRAGKHSNILGFVPTGFSALDLIIGGGYSNGGFVEIAGPVECGKSTFILHAIAAVQKKGGVACLIDADHALEPTFAMQLGVKSESLLLSKPKSVDQALGIIEKLVDCDSVDLLVVDSVVPFFMEACPGYLQTDQKPHRHANKMRSFLKKLSVVLRKRQVVILFVNLTSDNNTSRRGVFWDYALTRLRIEPADRVKRMAELSKIRIKVEVIKNRGKVLNRSVTLDLVLGYELLTDLKSGL